MKWSFARWRFRDFEDWHVFKDEYIKYKWRRAMEAGKLQEGSGSRANGTVVPCKKGLSKKMQKLSGPGPKLMKKTGPKLMKKAEISHGDGLIRSFGTKGIGSEKGGVTTGPAVGLHKANLPKKMEKLVSPKHVEEGKLSFKDGLSGSNETPKASTQIQTNGGKLNGANNMVINSTREESLCQVKFGTRLECTTRKYPPRGRASAVRAFPSGCGTSVVGGNRKELPQALVLGTKSIGEEKALLGVESVLNVSSPCTFPIGYGRSVSGGDGKELEKAPELGSKSIGDKIALPGVKKVVAVSAVRKFPVGCGRSVNGGDRKVLPKVPPLGSKSIGDKKAFLGVEPILTGEKGKLERFELQPKSHLSRESKSVGGKDGVRGVDLSPIELKVCNVAESQFECDCPLKSKSEGQEKVENGVELSPIDVEVCNVPEGPLESKSEIGVSEVDLSTIEVKVSSATKSQFVINLSSESKSDGHEKAGIGAELRPIDVGVCSLAESQCLVALPSKCKSDDGIGVVDLCPIEAKDCGVAEPEFVIDLSSESKSEGQEKVGIAVELNPINVEVHSVAESQIVADVSSEYKSEVGIGGLELSSIDGKVCSASKSSFVTHVPLGSKSGDRELVEIGGAELSLIDVKVCGVEELVEESKFVINNLSESKSALDEEASVEVVMTNADEDAWVGIASEHIVDIFLGSKSMDDGNAQTKLLEMRENVEKTQEGMDVQLFEKTQEGMDFQLFNGKDEKENETRKRKRDEKTQIDGKGSEWVEVDCSLHYTENETVRIEQDAQEVAVPSGGSLKEVVTRKKVKDTLRAFQAMYRKLLHEQESKLHKQGLRADLATYKLFKDKVKELGVGKKYIGNVPGVEVGDEFHLRVEMCLIGLHCQHMAGIDYVKKGGRSIAISIVSAGRYADDVASSGVLEYSGCGVPNQDQKLERGNLALKNSMDTQTPVRVIHGFKGYQDSRSREAWAKKLPTYVYDGLYLVEDYWRKMGKDEHYVFLFRLRRIPGQPELAINEIKKSKNLKSRHGLLVNDISQGEEKIPIPVFNGIDAEHPMPFRYINKIMYPSKYSPIPPRGCDCIDGCSDSEKCACAVKNGGEIPFNYGGAIVKAKPLVYECGPSCKCPPSCHNRVSQRGIKIPLEIFKTESRGWGVRSLTSIPSGSFICEYVGELLDEAAVERRVNDEYLFEIGSNYYDESLWEGLSTYIPDLHNKSHCEVVDEAGLTIDAAAWGNVGRFINHSCSPNLYAQNLLYDHDDKRMPHIMFFASENIPPMQELTYHYNYAIDQVHDSDGNIKKKNCYCGSSECSGRLY